MAGCKVSHIWMGRPWSHQDDPAAVGEAFCGADLKPKLNRLSPAERKILDSIQYPNEGGFAVGWLA